jgi:hypothetical protein
MSDPQGWWARIPRVEYVTSDELEDFAFRTGREITMRPTHAEMRVGSVLFKAPLPLPAAEVAS